MLDRSLLFSSTGLWPNTRLILVTFHEFNVTILWTEIPMNFPMTVNEDQPVKNLTVDVAYGGMKQFLQFDLFPTE